MGKREGKIEKALVRRIKDIGGEVRKAMWIAHRGCPDRRAMIPKLWREHLRWVLPASANANGQNPWVECKATGEPLEDYQEREHKKMRRHGELVLIIDTLEDIDRYFPLVP